VHMFKSHFFDFIKIFFLVWLANTHTYRSLSIQHFTRVTVWAPDREHSAIEMSPGTMEVHSYSTSYICNPNL
jgi:hypothetical protein